ncbi:MAG: Clp1/GlmU family protein [Bacillota bacterium]|nr:Clp1/GlmU family protein [Bacillota bacterium]
MSWAREWSRACAQVVASPGAVLLVGAPDTGKSTLATWLVNACLQAGHRVAVVDADVGQSDVGPPGTVGLGYPGQPIEHLDQVPASALAFVGATSPARSPAHHVVATASMVGRARREGAAVVVVDTTGTVSGRLGHMLKELKMAAISPEWVVALEREDELAPILRGLRGRTQPRLLRVPPSGRARERCREERRANRERLLGCYLQDAAPLDISLTELGVVNSFWEKDVREEVPEREWQNLWVGLTDDRGEVLAAGTILEASYAGDRLRVLTPWKEARAVRGIIVGSMRVTSDGREAGSVVSGARDGRPRGGGPGDGGGRDGGPRGGG